ncbi:MAG: Bifunctional oligoribonuclease and PAP phosphatase NrnA [Syntrophorhabdus sp. PtaU1.Bin058]|nr:MAG: Bifunctional oligoribonuclease and PAP phosphatase NrnA [Syntrophorhabdus sp. PtaU1.Bin058]
MFAKIRKIIDNGQDFFISTHIDPDGDAIGSVFSMYWALRSLGKNATVYLKDQVPYRYEFLPGPDLISHAIPERVYDAAFVLDCGELARIGEGYENLKRTETIISIDHHNTNEGFGRINVLDTGASSTGEILYRLYKYLGISLSYEMAVNIYTAIVTDTGFFRYENTGPKALLICEKMMRLGVKPAQVSGMVNGNHPKERFLLLGRIFSTLRTFDDGRVAMAYVTGEMFEDTHSTREYTDGFAEILREIRGVEVAILLRQVGDRQYKISMRSKGTVDVAEVCGIFGGGGHKNAAGCHIDGDITEVETKILEAMKR